MANIYGEHIVGFALVAIGIIWMLIGGGLLIEGERFVSTALGALMLVVGFCVGAHGARVAVSVVKELIS